MCATLRAKTRRRFSRSTLKFIVACGLSAVVGGTMVWLMPMDDQSPGVSEDADGNLIYGSPTSPSGLKEVVADLDADGYSEAWSVTGWAGGPKEFSVVALDPTPGGEPGGISVEAGLRGQGAFYYQSEDKNGDGVLDQQLVGFSRAGDGQTRRYYDLDGDGTLDKMWDMRRSRVSILLEDTWCEVVDKGDPVEDRQTCLVQVGGREAHVRFTDGRWHETEEHP